MARRVQPSDARKRMTHTHTHTHTHTRTHLGNVKDVIVYYSEDTSDMTDTHSNITCTNSHTHIIQGSTLRFSPRSTCAPKSKNVGAHKEIQEHSGFFLCGSEACNLRPIVPDIVFYNVQP